MTRFIFALLVMTLSILACGQFVTPIPASIETPAVTASPPPLPSVAPTPMATPAASATRDTAVVLAASLNVREGPGTEYPAKEEHLFAGQGVTVVACKDEWCEISAPVAGFVYQGCLSVDSGLGCEANDGN